MRPPSQPGGAVIGRAGEITPVRTTRKRCDLPRGRLAQWSPCAAAPLTVTRRGEGEHGGQCGHAEPAHALNLRSARRPGRLTGRQVSSP